MANRVAIHQLRIQAIDVLQQFVKVILRVFESQIERYMAQLMFVIDQQRFLAMAGDVVVPTPPLAPKKASTRPRLAFVCGLTMLDC